jgi:beta-glucosidase
MLLLTLVITIVLSLTLGCQGGIQNPNGTSEPDFIPYPDPSLPPSDRARTLLSIMTLEEKVGQMTQIERVYLQDGNPIAEFHLGSVLSGGGSSPNPNTPAAWADMIDDFQRQALSTRLRIPLLYGTDAVHGHNNLRGATIFPHNIGLGATANPQLVEEIARITAIEATATGIHWNFAPSIAVPQNIRWGRTYEGYSEDPELTALLGASAIRGYQGQDISEPGRLIATAKHFVGDGGTTEGIDQGDTQVSLEILRALHARPYIDAIEAGVKTIMVSYSSWNGIKLHGSRQLLIDMLRGELGFDGLILSDWGAVKQLSGNQMDQIEQAIMAGIDMIMVPDDYRGFTQSLIDLVNQGRVPMERIDDAVFRILRLKFEYGLFESPMVDRAKIDTIGSADHRAVARQAVRESMVVLKNHGVLPIGNEVQHIHVIGTKANDIGIQSGGWTITWQGRRGTITSGTTILEGIQSLASERGITVSYGRAIPDTTELVVLVIGELPYAEFEGDVDEPRLEIADLEFHRIALESNKPIATVLISGRPMIITQELEDWDGLVAAWLPGTEGLGVAEILFGDYAPTGRLPFTWPRSMKLYQLREATGGSPEAQDLESEILFPLGFGL